MGICCDDFEESFPRYNGNFICTHTHIYIYIYIYMHCNFGNVSGCMSFEIIQLQKTSGAPVTQGYTTGRCKYIYNNISGNHTLENVALLTALVQHYPGIVILVCLRRRHLSVTTWTGIYFLVFISQKIIYRQHNWSSSDIFRHQVTQATYTETETQPSRRSSPHRQHRKLPYLTTLGAASDENPIKETSPPQCFSASWHIESIKTFELCCIISLTHKGLCRMANILQATFSYSFSFDHMLCSFIKLSPKFVPIVLLTMSQLVQTMAWHRTGGKPSSEPSWPRLLTHGCVTRPWWVNRTIH